MFNLNARGIALCVFINYNMEMLKILGEYKLSIQNSLTCKFVKKRGVNSFTKYGLIT